LIGVNGAGEATERRKAPWASPQAIERRLKRQRPPAPIEPARAARLALFLAADDSAMCAGNGDVRGEQ
jgi:hypothetical protein